VRQRRLQNISTTGVDSGGREGTPGDSIRGRRQRVVRQLERKSCAISRLVDCGQSGSIPAASTIFYIKFKHLQEKVSASACTAASCYAHCKPPGGIRGKQDSCQARHVGARSNGHRRETKARAGLVWAWQCAPLGRVVPRGFGVRNYSRCICSTSRWMSVGSSGRSSDAGSLGRSLAQRASCFCARTR